MLIIRSIGQIFLVVVDSDMSHHYRINGSMIQQFAGKPVSLIGTVNKVKENSVRFYRKTFFVQVHPAGNAIDLETTDKQNIVVRLTDPVNRFEIGRLNRST